MGEEQLTVELVVLRKSGRLALTHVPHYQFFVDDVATGVEDARVIGQRQNIPIGDAIAMGFEEDDLMNLDGYDLEQDNFSRESEHRRGYIEEEGDEIATGGRMRKILLTEAYIRFDLDGLGIPQLYRFWMGGTSYKYLDHERVDEVPYS